jgi:hypothetical protein
MKPQLPVLSLVLILSAAAAAAEPVSADGFSAAFPCRTKLERQVVAADKLKIPVAARICDNKGALYYVVISDFPKGFIAKKGEASALADAVGGAAANIKGTVKTNTPFMLGKTMGRDALIGVPGEKAAVHLRVFFAGDRQFQAMVVAPDGGENGKAATAFLNSFKLK